MGRAETHGNFAACRAMRERVSAWHDGVGEHDDVLTDHLSACADCRSFAAALPPLTQRLTAWADAPDARLAALAARLESHTGGGSLRRLGAPARGA
ncbi:MAG: hypothetical protein FJ293_03320, partial [Planctomycetes bacterium]|nr:hypothetical protein [Planctomycetota bacterium]